MEYGEYQEKSPELGWASYKGIWLGQEAEGWLFENWAYRSDALWSLRTPSYQRHFPPSL